MKNRISIKLLACAVLLAFTVVVINGCNDEEGTPENVSTKQIGNEGGALSASDGNVSLTIPSGAMADGTQVSIQATETVAPKGVGKVYTLSPEGTQFSKPVALSFQYTDEDVKTIPLSRMAIAFKKEDDTWQIMPTVKVDETTRTITTETNHFSQWSIIDGLPAITSFSPASANDDVNTTISITGKNFSSVPSENVVTVNDVPVVVAAVSGDQLIVMLPAGGSTGKIKVVVNGNAVLSADNFTVVNTTPSITSFTPAIASEGITTTVSITGTNFSTVVAENVVSVNGIQATVVSATTTQLVVILPGTITTGPIKVVVKGKITQSAENFTVLASVPTITSFTPTSMEEGIVTVVAITGTNFSSTLSENVVSINGLPLTVAAATTTQLMVTVPANASTGQIKVAVKDKIVQSASSFTVVATAPKITDFTPTSMQQGIVTTVSISGINFSATPSENVVSINGLPVTVVSSTSTQLVVIIPANASTGPIQIVVKNKIVQSASNFTVVPVSPTITSFSPASTPEGTPTNVTINGTNFSTIVSENVVTLNGVPLTAQVVTTSGTASTMVVLVPANATSGRFQVTVKGITVTASSDFTVTSTFPSIGGFSPTSGTKGIDTTITITGANFSTVASENHVTINGFPATVLSATSTTLSVIIPGSAPSGHIQVTVGDKVVQSAAVFTFN